jgi:hypothetical protein
MELGKFIHDFTIIGAFIVIALLPRLVVALAEAKANARKQAEEGRVFPALFQLEGVSNCDRIYEAAKNLI